MRRGFGFGSNARFLDLLPVECSARRRGKHCQTDSRKRFLSHGSHLAISKIFRQSHGTAGGAWQLNEMNTRAREVEEPSATTRLLSNCGRGNAGSFLFISANPV